MVKIFISRIKDMRNLGEKIWFKRFCFRDIFFGFCVCLLSCFVFIVFEFFLFGVNYVILFSLIG